MIKKKINGQLQDFASMGGTQYESLPAASGGTDLSLVTTGDKYTWGNKVDKVAGKGLSTNDYSDTEKGKVADNTGAIEAIVNEYGAKNLLPNNATSQTSQGVIFTVNADGIITANGTPTMNFPLVTVANNLLLKAGTYILSSGLDSTSIGYMHLTDEANTYVIADTYAKQGGEAQFTLNADTYVRATAVIYMSEVATNVVIKPMIRDARITDPTYVPYAMTNSELTDAVTKHSIVKRANFINATGETVLSDALPLREAVIHAFLVVYGGYYPGNDSGAWIVVQSPIPAQDFVLELAEHNVDMAYAPSTNIMTFNQTSGNADTVEIVVFRLY